MGSICEKIPTINFSIAAGFDGIDNRKYSFEGYPSVMNCNHQLRHVDYPSSGVLNYLGYLQENGFKLHDYCYGY